MGKGKQNGDGKGKGKKISNPFDIKVRERLNAKKKNDAASIERDIWGSRKATQREISDKLNQIKR